MGEREGEYIYKIVKDADGVYCYIKTGTLVRCKDCKYRSGDYCQDREGFAHYGPFLIHMDDFCINGERKENEIN